MAGAFVPVHKRAILDHRELQRSGFLHDGGIELFTVKRHMGLGEG
jgi:hypothetical protein